MYTISQIAKKINGEIDGDPTLQINGVCDLKESIYDHLSYIVSEKYEKLFYKSKSMAMIVNKNFNIDRGNKTLIYVDNPAMRFIDVINMFHPQKPKSENIHQSAIVSDCAQIGNNVNISPNVVIENDVKIGDNVKIGANTFIGENTTINNECIIYPNVTIYNNIIIGRKCIIDSGSVIGSDGFGLVKDENNLHHKMPHLGGVIIGDNVWIGSNCAIDRGTLSNTIIKTGAKLDNLIHIAHNVEIGNNCIIAAQVGIAGSTVLEENVTLAGQVGIVGHIRIKSGSIVAAKSVVFQSLKKNSFVSGIPAREHKDRLRQDVVIKQLPEILNRIRDLEK